MKYIILIILMVFFASCRTQYVPIEKMQTKIEYRDKIQKDSIHIHDSIYTLIKGDTVYLSKYKTIFKDRYVRDTILLSDTIKTDIPYPVEKSLTKWQQLKLDIGELSIGFITALIAVIVWLVYKKCNK